jgi:hypothetical protein
MATAVSAARDAVERAGKMRRRLARRRTPHRDAELRAMQGECAEAAVPLRSYIGMVAWHDLPVEQELAMKDAIAALRYERRQIGKML